MTHKLSLNQVRDELYDAAFTNQDPKWLSTAIDSDGTAWRYTCHQEKLRPSECTLSWVPPVDANTELIGISWEATDWRFTSLARVADCQHDHSADDFDDIPF